MNRPLADARERTFPDKTQASRLNGARTSCPHSHETPLIDSAHLRDPWLWGVVLIQIASNAFFLAKRTLWLDEAYSALMASRSFSEMLHALRYDAGPPLYYALLRVWRFVFGDSEAALRSLSLLFAVFATVGVYLFARRYWNRATGLWAACFFALSPIATAYARETRNYTLFAALCLAFAGTLIHYLFHGRRKSLVLCGVFALLMVYTHNVGWFVGLAGAVCAVAFAPERKRLIPLSICGASVILFYLPWTPILWEQLKHTELTITWAANFWSPKALLQTVYAFTPGGSNPSYLQLPVFYRWIQFVNTLALAAVFVLSCISAVRQRDRKAGIAIAFLIAGLAGPYLYSLLKTPVYLAGRTDFGLFPFFCLALAYGASRVPWKAVRLAFWTLFLIQACVASALYLSHDDAISERDAVLYLQKHARPGDVILCTGLTRPPFEYALRDRGLTFLSYPRDMENHLAHLNESWYLKNADLKIESDSVIRQAVQITPNDSTLWALVSQRPINKPFIDLLNAKKRCEIEGTISTPKMGLRKLGEPIQILRLRTLRTR